MSPELDEKLCHRFPLLYMYRHASMMSTCMCWGFECGDGWYEIIFNLSKKLEKMIEALPEEEREHYRASQVKEKYGTLHFYLSGQTDEMDDAIDEAEALSAKTCEECGAPGKLNNGPWYMTRCEEHAKVDS